MKRPKHTHGAPDEACRFKTSVLKVLAITSVVHGYKDANVASTNRLPRVSLFLLVQVKCFGDFSTMHRLKKFVYLKTYSQGYTPTPLNVTYHNSSL